MIMGPMLMPPASIIVDHSQTAASEGGGRREGGGGRDEGGGGSINQSALLINNEHISFLTDRIDTVLYFNKKYLLMGDKTLEEGPSDGGYLLYLSHCISAIRPQRQVSHYQIDR